MAPTYKLTYFNAKALAEPIRFILAYAGVDYEDERIEGTAWPELKPKTKWGQVPILTIDGETYTQSMAICRYLARKFNLVGSGEREAFLCDEFADAIKDLMPELRPLRTETDEVKKAEMKKKLYDETFPKFFEKIERELKNNGGKYLVGKSLTWTDLLYAHYFSFFTVFLEDLVLPPALKAYQESIFAIPQIKAWINKRPESQF